MGYLAAPLGGTSIACALGAALGVSLHWRLREIPVRLAAIWAGCGAGWLLIKLFEKVMLTWELPSRVLGPDRLYLVTQACIAFAGWAVLLLGLRWSSQRYAVFVAAEGALAASSIVWVFVGHRQGFINRPFWLVDHWWAQGYDPLPVFLFFGVLCALVVGALAASHHHGRRSLWDLPLLVLLLTIGYLLLPPSKVKQWSEEFGKADGNGKEQRYSDKDKDKDRPKSKGRPRKGKGSEGDKSSASPSPGDKGGEGDKKDSPSFADTQPPPNNPPVAVVVFRDDYTPESGYYYFRQTAFSEYNGIKLVRSSDAAYDRDNPDGYPTHTQVEKPNGETMGIQPPQWDDSAFLHLQTRVALMTPQARPFAISNPVRFWACENPDPSRFQKAYDAESMALTLPYRQMLGKSAGDPNWDSATWAHYTEGPRDKRYKELMEKILADIKPEFKRDQFQKAIAIKLWLDENCTYSLHSRYEGSDDPVGDYLFGDRVGYCVFTAHAACYLFRAAGIPARIADGYAVPARARGNSSSLLLRAKEAHSWPEIYLEGVGWIELDIAPKKNLEPAGDPVDSGLQGMLGDMARKDQKHKTPDQPKKTIDLQQLVRQLLAQLTSAFPLSLLLTALFLMSVKLYRRWAPHIPWISRRNVSKLCYRSTLDQLADRGLVRSFGESREEFARKNRAAYPSLGALTRLHLAAALGPREIPPGEIKAAYRAVQQELDKSPKDWRYWLQFCNPVSWWSVN